MASGNEVAIYWVPAHAGVTGNEKADEMAKEAAGSRFSTSRTKLGSRLASPTSLDEPPGVEPGPPLKDPGPRPTGAVIPPPKGDRPPAQSPPQGPGVDSTALLPAAVRPRCDRIFPPRPDDRPPEVGDECWWCNCGKRQSRHHIFTECRAWASQIRVLWKRIGKDCRWEHTRAPSMRWVWKEDATEAVIEFLEDTPVGSRSSRMARAKLGDRESVGQVSEGEEGRPGPP